MSNRPDDMNKISDNKKTTGRLSVALSAVIFGFTPILAQMSYAGGNNGINMAFLRALIPIPFLFLISKKVSMGQSLSKKLKIKGAVLGLLLFGFLAGVEISESFAGHYLSL